MIDWLFSLQGMYLYGGIFLLLMGGAFGLPIPEDLPLLFGGVLLHQGHAELLYMFASCYTGIILGDIFIFSVGRKIGSSPKRRGWLESKLSPSMLRRTKVAMERKSFMTILVARHLFYLRTVTFLACGALKMSYLRFILADMFAALISATFMLCLGFMFADSYPVIVEIFHRTKIVVLIAAVLVAFLFWRFKIRKIDKKRNSDD